MPMLFVDLHQEDIHVEYVGVHPEPSGIAAHLKGDTAEHAGEEAPCTVSDCETDLSNQNCKKYEHVDQVARDCGGVSDCSLLQTTCFESA